MITDAINSAPDVAESSEAILSGSNVWIAGRLRQVATLLAAQDANLSRVSSYRRAADAIAALDVDIEEVAETTGLAGLEAIPGVGPSMAGAVMEMLGTGRWGFLERLTGATEPEALFCSVPGIGLALAHRIHESLKVDSLEELEAAAHDGRLARLSGFGPRRAAVVRATLAELLGRFRPPAPRRADEPAVALLLDVDREYRSKAAQGVLHTILPRRFNPDHEARLPVLHTVRGRWHFTVLYCNTARAHRLGRTDDWVVVYFHRDDKPEGRRTIVSEIHGPARTRRVVRGRETEFRGAEAAKPAA